MFILRLFVKLLLLPLLLVLFIARMMFKIGTGVFSFILGGMMLVVLGCMISAIVRQMWPSAMILAGTEAGLIIVSACIGVLEYLLGEASKKLCGFIRS